MQDLALFPERSVLVIIDVQEKLVAAMPSEDAERVVRNANILIEAASALNVPTLVTEQYPKGLGKTVAPLSEKLGGAQVAGVVEKVEFDASLNSAFLDKLTQIAPSASAKSIVLAGMEAHICVFQTARGLRRRGFTVHVATDATSSRHKGNWSLAQGLWQQTGAVVSSTETIAFDWVGRAGTDAFKAVSKLVR